MDEPSISVSTNNVNRSDWLSFIDYVTRSAGLKATLKRVYLLGLGKCLEVVATSENSIWYGLCWPNSMSSFLKEARFARDRMFTRSDALVQRPGSESVEPT